MDMRQPRTRASLHAARPPLKISDDSAREIITNLSRGTATISSEATRLAVSQLTVRKAVARMIGKERTRLLIKQARSRIMSQRACDMKSSLAVGQKREIQLRGHRVATVQRIGQAVLVQIARKHERAVTNALEPITSFLLPVDCCKEVTAAISRAARSQT